MLRSRRHNRGIVARVGCLPSCHNLHCSDVRDLIQSQQLAAGPNLMRRGPVPKRTLSLAPNPLKILVRALLASPSVRLTPVSYH